MNIAALLRQQATTTPDATALIEGVGLFTQRVSFAELERESNGIARGLSINGIGVGDPVLVLHPVTARLYAILIALFKLGAIPVFIDPTFTPKQIRTCVERARPVACITSKRTALVPKFIAELRTLRMIVAPNDAGYSGSVLTDVPAQTPALITFTSGSTGMPKGIVRSHEFLRNQLAIMRETLRLKAGDVEFTTLPIFVLANIAAGMTTVLAPTRHRAKSRVYVMESLRLISEHGVNRIAAAPTFVERLCSRSTAPLDSVKRIDTGGGPVYPVLLEKLKRCAPNAETHMIYGSTECEPISSIAVSELLPTDLKRMHSGSGIIAGHIDPSTRVRIVRSFDLNQLLSTKVSADEKSIDYAATNEIGEIVVAGEHVIKGYLHGVGDSETKVKIGNEIWHRTGDAGYIDESGRLWLVGRASSAVSDKYGTFYPFQIEAPARSHPAIKRAAFAQHQGKRILLVEAPRGRHARINPAQIRREFDWAHIDRVIAIKKIPLDVRHGSKVDYRALASVLNCR